MPGPPKTPTAIKESRGTLEKSRVNPNEPRPELAKPNIPKWLDDEGQKAFEELAIICHDLEVLAESDKMALGLLCDAFSRWKKAKEFLAKNGNSYECQTANGTIYRTYPEVGIESDSWKRIKNMIVEFGLTPASRARVGVIDGQGVKDDKVKRINDILGK